MSCTRVKICGITSSEDLFTAVEAGADALGFVVKAPRSPRNLSLEEARRLINATPVFVETVAVTIHNSMEQLLEVYEALHPDVIQIHSPTSFSQDLRRQLPGTRLIGAIQVKHGVTVEDISETAEVFDAITLDTYDPAGYGGTGRTHNWDFSKQVRDDIYPKPLILAGGLKPGNVKEAVSTVKPYAVDVSSGVESNPGVKDGDKVFEFIKNAREVEL
ncbi:MAG: phosphoribosylanthranilate isomerase [Candidatus Bathyarchaeia archaeon]